MRNNPRKFDVAAAEFTVAILTHLQDKTFGLKNKKGKKQQQFIKQVTQQVKQYGQGSAQKRAQLEFETKKKKKEDEAEQKEMQSLLKPVMGSQKISAGWNTLV